uniref:Uncharacterized protein n=1 Tax=Fagus sylvatica TaxID=28930 RepID=A0A2N9EDD3_FAGSY
MVLASQLLSHSSQYSLISASLSHLAKTHDCKGPRRADLKPTTSEKKPTKGGDETHDGEGEQREGLPCLCMEVCFTVDCGFCLLAFAVVGLREMRERKKLRSEKDNAVFRKVTNKILFYDTSGFLPFVLFISPNPLP